MNVADRASHCQQVRIHALAVHVFIALLLIFGACWLGLQGMVCWNGRADDAWQPLCRWFFLAPDLALLAAAAVGVMLVHRLWRAGHAVSDLPAAAKSSMRHARRGYRALPEVQPHVKASAAALSLGAGALFGGATFYLFYVDAWVGVVGALALTLVFYFMLRLAAQGED